MRPATSAASVGRVPGGAAQPDPVGVDAQQLGVVVEHFLEMRNGPVPGHRIAREAAVELVEQRRSGHCCQGAARHVPRRGGGVRAASPRIRGMGVRCLRRSGRVPDQEFEHCRGRELRRAAEAAVRLVFGADQGGHGFVQEGPVQGSGWPVEPDRGGRLGRGDAAREGGGVGLDGAAALHPGLIHGFEDLPEGGTARHGTGREVRACVERPAVGQEKDRHRPAALAADGLGRGHVDGVDVGAFFPVHLDGDEVGVQVISGAVVLEGFPGHDVAPVTGRIADGKEHRHVPGGRSGEGPVAERLPVHGVGGVLAQVGGGFRRQGIRGAWQRTGGTAVSGCRIPHRR